MIVRSNQYLDLEVPVEASTSWITPVEHFFVRNHMFEPTTLDARTWKVTVTGEVDHALELRMADLLKYAPPR